MPLKVLLTCIGIFFLRPAILVAQTDSIAVVDSLAQLSLEQLMNIKVVTAAGFTQTASEAPATIRVITAQEIKDRGYEQLQDALRDIPGIDMIHINGYSPTLIYFRGMYGAENLRALLMVDGIVENNILGTNDMAGPAYSLHNVDRIEIIWGPASALYGANAFGGVINIITKKGAQIDGLEAEQGVGSFNTTFEKLTMGTRKGNWEFSLAGTLYNSDGPKFTNRSPDYSASFVDNARSFNGELSYYAKRAKTTLGYRFYRTPMGYGTFFNSATSIFGLPSQGYDNLGVIGLLSGNVRGEKGGVADYYLRTGYLQNEFKPSDKFTLLSRVVYRETGTADDSYLYITFDGKKFIRGIFTSFSNRVSGEVTANYLPKENQRISGGIQYFRDNVEQGQRKSTLDLTTPYLLDGRDTVYNLYAHFLSRKNVIRDNIGGYLQYVLNTSILNKTSFTLGTRYDYNSYFGSSFNPRAVIVNQPNKNLTFKLQFGTAFRAPTENEIIQVPDSFHLKTEKIRTYEADAIFAISSHARLQLNVFRNELRDVIVLQNLTGLTFNKNPGKENINGLELSGDFFMSPKFSAFMNFTYQDAQFENLVTHVQGDLPDMAKFKGNAGITFGIGNLFTLNIIENWVGTRRSPRTDPYGPVKGYALTNLTFSTKELFNKGITASINVQNLFNTKWLDPGFRTADGALFSTVLEQPGINGLLKVGIKF
ncbi:MAG: TonB-dependent receptor plug domain-containing protein [Ginsengibacter sp.]